MTLKHLLTFVAVATTLTFVGCKENNVNTPKAATFQLEQIALQFDAAGGEATVAYTITNPVQGGAVLTDCTEEWIKNLSTATYGSIKFTVAPNYTNKMRRATINVQYTGVEESISITIDQGASDAPTFSYKVILNEPRTLVLDVTPADKETAFICDTYSKSHLEAFQLDNDTALFNYHLEALGYRAARAGQSLLNYLHNTSYKGDTMDVEFTELVADTDYVVFSYYIDLSTATLIGDIYREVIHNAAPEKVDTIFTMELTAKNNTISQKITASNEETYYHTGYWSVTNFNNYYGVNADRAATFIDKWNRELTYKIDAGATLDAIFAEFCQQGSQTIENTGLENYTEYIFYIFAVDPKTGFAASDAIVQTATTTSAIDSGVTIDITVEDVLARSANVYWKASSKKAKFRRSVFSKAEFDALGATDAERFATIKAEDIEFFEATGETDMNLTENHLSPNTTYVAFAYGVDGEAPNTRIFTKEFTTLSDTPGQSNITISWNDIVHYNAAEVAAIDAEHWGDYAGATGMAILPATISGVSDGDAVYIWASWMVEDYYKLDSEWIRDLLQDDKYRVDCYEHYNFVIDYCSDTKDCTIVAIARDANGNLGRLFKQAAKVYESDSVDAESYVYKENK